MAMFRGTPSGASPGATFGPGEPQHRQILDDDILEPDILDEGPRLATLLGTPSAAAREALDATTTYTGWRVRVGGVDLPAATFGPVVTFEDGTENPAQRVALTLLDPAFSPLRTLRTWSRHQPWELYFRQGLPGEETEELVFLGYPLDADQKGTDDPELTLRLGDWMLLYSGVELCHEVEPFSGLSRGDLVQELASDAGIPAVVTPTSGPYNAPHVWSNDPLLSALQSLGEPLGWRWRARPDQVLEAFAPRLKIAPRAPDQIWTAADFDSLTLSPPENPLSLVLVRGFGALEVDAEGSTTETRRTEIKGLRAVQVATQKQLVTGAVVATGFVQGGEEERVVRVIEVATTQLGDRLISTRTREWGWFNPAAAQLRTQKSGEGDGPVEGGYWPSEVYLNEAGQPVSWPQEEFTLLADEVSTPTYDGTGTQTGAVIEIAKWFSRTHAVKDAAALWFLNIPVGGDGQSYLLTDPRYLSVEEYGPAERVEVTLTYGSQGAVENQVEKRFAYYSPRGAVGVGGNMELYNGEAQTEPYAGGKILVQQTTTVNVVAADGVLDGQIRLVEGYRALHRSGGTYDYGEFESGQVTEDFGFLERENVSYLRRTENAVDEITVDGQGLRKTRLLQGRAPLPSYLSSPWTTLRQRPVEYLLSGATWEACFGRRQLIVSHDHVLTQEQAQALAEEKAAASRRFQCDVVRSETTARPGDTVHLQDPLLGLDHRGLVTSRRRLRNAATGEATATYTVEVEL